MRRWQKNLLIILAMILLMVLVGPLVIPVPELESLSTVQELVFWRI